MKKKLAFFLAVSVSIPLVLFWFYLSQTSEGNEEKASTEERDRIDAPVYFTTMTHLEGNWLEAATNAVYFNKVATELRYGMALAEEYDAVLTFESEIPFAEGMTRFEENVFAEALERGHGVGTHCDIPPDRTFTTAELTRELKKRKAFIDALVGEENNMGCSGVAGHAWYEPMVAAGFSYLDGIVGSHYITMPLSGRPDDSWTDEALSTTYWHARAPYNEDERYYPFFVKSDEDFTEDVDGDLLVSGGDLGGPLANFAEADPVTGETTTCKKSCPLTDEDVDEVLSRIRAFLQTRDTSRVAKLQVYLPASIFDSTNEGVLRNFFNKLKTLQDAGQIQWASQRDVYKAAEEDQYGSVDKKSE